MASVSLKEFVERKLKKLHKKALLENKKVKLETELRLVVEEREMGMSPGQVKLKAQIQQVLNTTGAVPSSEISPHTHHIGSMGSGGGESEPFFNGILADEETGEKFRLYLDSDTNTLHPTDNRSFIMFNKLGLVTTYDFDFDSY